MKNVTIVIIAIIIVVSLNSMGAPTAQNKSFEEARQQVERGNSGTPTNAQAVERDRYAKEKVQADEKQRRWQDSDSRLEDRLANMAPCSRDTANIVAQTRDLAFESFKSHNAYYDTWLQDRQNDLNVVREVMQKRGALRRGIEADLTSSKQELAGLIERRRTLESSLAAAKSRPGDEMKALDALIANESKRIKDYERALEQWDSALASGKSALDLLEEQKADIAQFKRLLESASGFWLAYYHAIDARAMLRGLGNCGPQPPTLPELPPTNPRPFQY